MEVTGAWCVFFHRPGLSGLGYRSLKHAYRAPSLFLSKMRNASHNIRDLTLDERLTDLDFSKERLHESAQIFYLSTHGIFAATGYNACLNKDDWYPSKTGIGNRNTVVAVFDTCYLIDSGRNWRNIWAQAKFGNALRLMLGFDNLVAIDRGHAVRGFAFADNLLNGDTFVDAWFKAVASTTPKPYNKAIAIGIGDDPQDAINVVTTASLSNIPGRRTGSATFFGLKP